MRSRACTEPPTELLQPHVLLTGAKLRAVQVSDAQPATTNSRGTLLDAIKDGPKLRKVEVSSAATSIAAAAPGGVDFVYPPAHFRNQRALHAMRAGE